MTNAESLMQGLMEIEDDEVAEMVADAINCPSSSGCTYDGGKDHTPCVVCKVKWLRDEWEY